VQRNDGINDYQQLYLIKAFLFRHNKALLDNINCSPGAALPLKNNIGNTSGIWKDTSGIMTSTQSRTGGCGPTGNHVQEGCTSYSAQSPWRFFYTRLPEAYLGIRVHSGVNIYFAWVKARVVVANQFANHLTVTIEDYAFNNSPNQYILAEQTK
jgi:hypothetical protein